MAINKPKQFPKWMLKKCSENKRDAISTSLRNSNLSSKCTAEKRVRAKKTLYCMTEKELTETAKEILNKAEKDHFLDDKKLKSESSFQKEFNKCAKIQKTTITSDEECSYGDLFSTEESGDNEANKKDSKIIPKPDLSVLDELFL